MQDKQLVFAKEEIKYLLQVKLRGAGDPAKSNYRFSFFRDFENKVSILYNLFIILNK